VVYHGGQYEASQAKNDIYSVEGDNAELCHYLELLARKSRFFSRCAVMLSDLLRCLSLLQSQATSKICFSELQTASQRLFTHNFGYPQ
jgi:hypothetical protein